MRSMRRMAVTSLITVALAMSGGAAWAADDDSRAPDDTGSAKVLGPPEWARLDCPAGLDPDERAALRTEHRAMMNSWRAGARAETDTWRDEHRALMDQATGDLTPEARAALLAEMEQLRTEHRSQMQAMQGDRRAQTQTLREERRAERDQMRSRMTGAGGPAGDTDS